LRSLRPILYENRSGATRHPCILVFEVPNGSPAVAVP